VLAKSNRVVRAEDYRGAVRRGRRITSASLVVYVLRRGGDAAPRFGFIVSKAVGNAVTRNLVRRRLKAASYLLLAELAPGMDVVVRALPPAARLSWVSLQRELATTLERALPTAQHTEVTGG
jgi:ribonuclease P protein component, eubacterial